MWSHYPLPFMVMSPIKWCEFNPSLSLSCSHALPCSGQHAYAKPYLSINNTVLFVSYLFICRTKQVHFKCISITQRTFYKITITFKEKVCLIIATVIFVLSSNFLYRFFCVVKKDFWHNTWIHNLSYSNVIVLYIHVNTLYIQDSS